MSMRRAAYRFGGFLAAFTIAPPLALMAACSTSSEGGSSPGQGSDASTDRARLPSAIHPDASCPVTIETPELVPGSHVPTGTAITWSSNPPSSGPHYPLWANFQDFSRPVDRGYLVHVLEHGGVVLFYRCDEGGTCDAIVDGLRKVRESLPTDPLCDPSIRVRVVIVPDPLIDAPVAAAAWGWTYKADCLDLPTLQDFAKAHYAQGTENICAAGVTTF